MSTQAAYHRSSFPEALLVWYDKLKAEGHCRMCLRPAEVRPLTRHHLIPQNWWIASYAHNNAARSLRNVATNIIPLCRPCHDLVERDVEERRMLRRVLTQAEVAFAIAVRGVHWLERVYPSES